MCVQILVGEFPTQTQYVPLAVLGHCVMRNHFFSPVWNELEWSMKTREHQPAEKLQDMLVSILAGNSHVSQINTRLRPDLALATAWQREQFAEQSNIARVLDRLSHEQIEQLRRGSQVLFRQHSQTLQHDFQAQWLVFDLDLTGLLASRRAEGSEKGYFSGQRNRYGRQVVRVSVPPYHETILSCLYPGNQSGNTTFKPTMQQIQTFLALTEVQRRRTILRSDAGLGTDENVKWALWLRYQVLTKGFSGRRAQSWAAKIPEQEWLPDPEARQRWIAWAPTPPRFGRRINVFVLRWATQKGLRHGTLLSTLFQLKPFPTWNLYDGRGAAEVEIKADKQGLRLPNRRKKSFAAQEGLILLTDLAHNLLSWVHHWVLEDTPFVDFGTARMVNELLCIPGQVEMKGGKLQKVTLLKTHPYAELMCPILHKLLRFFDTP